MARSISHDEALRLLRSAEAEHAAVEVVCTGERDQGVMLMGQLMVDEDNTVIVHVPDKLGFFISITQSFIEYSEPAEAPDHQRNRAKKLIKFLMKFQLGEWECMLRVWKDPEGPTIQ